MTSQDERREVAARLRDDDYCYGTEYGFFLRALGIKRDGNGPCDWARVHERLADLIDQACEMTYTGSFTAIHFARWKCGRCGAYAFAPGKWNAPRFCPRCGARVVTAGDAR